MEIKSQEIIGTGGKYHIRSNGDVISHYSGKAKVMKQGIMTSGYKIVVLKINGKQKSLSVHRLLAIHFIPNPNGLPQVNHKDGNKLNNDLFNLEWVSVSENLQHCYDNGLKKYKPLHYKGKTGFEHNRSIAVECSNGKTYGSMSEAGRYLNIDRSSVSWSIKHNKAIFGLTFKKVA